MARQVIVTQKFDMLNGNSQFDMCLEKLKQGKLYRVTTDTAVWKIDKIKQGHWYDLKKDSFLLYLDSNRHTWTHAFLDQHGVIVDVGNACVYFQMKEKEEQEQA
jgi:hypothetical protein